MATQSVVFITAVDAEVCACSDCDDVILCLYNPNQTADGFGFIVGTITLIKGRYVTIEYDDSVLADPSELLVCEDIQCIEAIGCGLKYIIDTGAGNGVGPQGPQGVAGPQGIPGPQGIQGVAGAQGVQGIQGLTGLAGNDGGVMKTVISAADGLDLTVLNDAVEVDVSGDKSAAIQLVEAFTGTLVFEASIGALAGNDNWFSLTGVNVSNDPVSSATAVGIFFFNVSTLSKLRVRVSIVGTGDIGYIITTSTV